MSKAAVVESSALAPRLAMMAGGRLISDTSAAQPDESLIVVASTRADVRAIAAMIDAGTRPRVVVAWHLPESSLVHLLDTLGTAVPCLIGEPEPTELQAVLDGTSRGVPTRAQRRVAARFAVLEGWLSQNAPKAN